MFLLVVALVESTSVPLRTQVIFLLFHLGTNIITMPLRFLYKEHLVILFKYNLKYNTIEIIKL